MNPSVSPVSSRHRYWPWVLALCLAPIVILGAAAYSFLTLDRDGAALRRQMITATSGDWHTKVQLSVGPLTLGLVRTGLSFADSKKMDDARLALRSVSRASVGVYERAAKADVSWSREKLCVDADSAMNRRGWIRLVGVVNHKEAVLVYVPESHASEGPIDICLSVLNQNTLVVVATTVSADGLAELVKRHTGDELKRSLRLAQF